MTGLKCPLCRKRPCDDVCGLLVFAEGECPVCLEKKSPCVALPCGHTLCQEDYAKIGGRLPAPGGGITRQAQSAQPRRWKPALVVLWQSANARRKSTSLLQTKPKSISDKGADGCTFTALCRVRPPTLWESTRGATPINCGVPHPRRMGEKEATPITDLMGR